MYVDSDAFRIAYDPSCVEPTRIMARIRRLGYAPEAVESLAFERERKEARTGPRTQRLPEPVSGAATQAHARTKPLLIDFYAAWCAPCKVLESETLTAREVRDALDAFEVVKVNTDRFPDAARFFDVVGLPTLVVLDPNGNERFRHLGPIGAHELAAALRSCVDDD